MSGAAEQPDVDLSSINEWIEANGEEVQVAFTVPVEVVVNLVTREVTRVVTIDESVALDTSYDGLPEVNTYGDYKGVTNRKVRELAGEIADSPEIEWPAWESGF